MSDRPGQADLVRAMADATRKAVSSLFRQHPEQFYYCALVTTGEAHAPLLSAWSKEALDAASARESDPLAARQALKWSYADSPYCGFGEDYYADVKSLFSRRPALSTSDPEGWKREWQFRVDAMEAAMATLDREGLFGQAAERSRIFINVEVAPPDASNTARAARLNPAEALQAWLAEASES